MYEIDVCYKIIFEAMLEENALEKIADRISKYTAAEVNICVRVWKRSWHIRMPVKMGKESVYSKSILRRKNRNITGNMGMTERDS